MLLDTLEPRRLFSGDLPIGGAVSGTIGSIGATDDWTFTARADEVYSFALSGTPTSQGFQAKAEILNQAGEEIREFLKTGHFLLKMKDSGLHTVRVRDRFNEATGMFRLAIERISPPSPDAVGLPKGVISGGTIIEPLDADQFVFDVAQRETITLSLTGRPITADFQPNIDVYDQAGNKITEYLGGGRHTLTLDGPGRYVVSAHDRFYEATGDYKIAFEGLSPISPNPGKPVIGAFASGSIADPIEVDQFTINGKAGDVLGIAITDRATSGNFQVNVDLYDSAGNKIWDLLHGGQRTIALPHAGTFTLDVHDRFYESTGSYVIGLETIKPTSPDARVLPPGVFRHGRVDNAIDVDQYTFRANQNERIDFTLVGKAIDKDFSLNVEIYDQSGQKVFERLAGVHTFTAPHDGVYTVQVHDRFYERRGRYSIAANWVAPARGSISGVVFEDLNGNRIQDTGERPLAYRPYLDMNRNGRKDIRDVLLRPDPDGFFVAYGVSAGTYYLRLADRPAGTVLTAPQSGVYKIVLARGQNATGKNFGVGTAPRTSAVSRRFFDRFDEELFASDDAVHFPAT